MIPYYIFKIFFKTDKGKFRYYFLFPIISCLISSYIIFMTLSIMDGMENNIVKRFKAFNYSSYIMNLNENDIKTMYYENIIENEGFERVSILSNDYNRSTVLVHNYKYLEDFIYKKKLDEYMINFTDKITKNNIVIGSDLADNLDLSIGDDVLLSSPIDVNMSSGTVPSKKLTVSGIFKLDIYDYDSRYVLTSLNSTEELYSGANNMNYYLNDIYLEKDFSIHEIFNNNYFNNVLISAINFEKKIYSLLGVFILIVSLLMLFSIMSLSVIEKSNQASILSAIGLNQNSLIFYLFIINSSIGIFFSFLGCLMTNLTLFMNVEYGFFNILFKALPFDVIMNELNLIKTLCIIIILGIVFGLSGSIPLLFNKREINLVRNS